MLAISEVIVVEGKHDKIRLEQLVDAFIITTDGFRLYKNKEKIELLRRLSAQRGIIILTDSDNAGFRIRNHIRRCLGDINIKNAYIPEIKGKERRKTKPGSEGLLGVEGVSNEIILSALEKAKATPAMASKGIGKADFFADGFAGGKESAQKRRRLAKKMGLPMKISANAMIDVINLLYTREQYERIIDEEF